MISECGDQESCGHPEERGQVPGSFRNDCRDGVYSIDPWGQIAVFARSLATQKTGDLI